MALDTTPGRDDPDFGFGPGRPATPSGRKTAVG